MQGPHEAMWLALAKLGFPNSTIHNMQATIQLDGTPISVDNGLRQGCCMAPVLFNLYACLFVECWTERNIRYKHAQKLFRRYTRNADETRFTELQFADDAALLATTRDGAEDALRKYIKVAADFGRTVSIPKTKLVVSNSKGQASNSCGK